jgi:hypothetical protein
MSGTIAGWSDWGRAISGRRASELPRDDPEHRAGRRVVLARPSTPGELRETGNWAGVCFVGAVRSAPQVRSEVQHVVSQVTDEVTFDLRVTEGTARVAYGRFSHLGPLPRRLYALPRSGATPCMRTLDAQAVSRTQGRNRTRSAAPGRSCPATVRLSDDRLLRLGYVGQDPVSELRVRPPTRFGVHRRRYDGGPVSSSEARR